MKKSEFRAVRKSFWRATQGSPDREVDILVDRDVIAAEAAGVVWEPEDAALPERVTAKRPHGQWTVVKVATSHWDYLNQHEAQAVSAVYNRLQAGELVEKDALLQPALDATVRERDRLQKEVEDTARRLGHVQEMYARENRRVSEMENALHRLAQEAAVPDDGPDEIVSAVLARLKMFLDGCERRAGALHRLAKEAGVSNINGDEAVVDAVLKKVERGSSLASKIRDVVARSWPYALNCAVNGTDNNGPIVEIHRLLSEVETS